jgi:anti-sigma factor RsiW
MGMSQTDGAEDGVGMGVPGEWHADERLLAGYVAGTLALPAAMSLEQHVMRCSRCRDAVAGQVDPRPLDLVWQGIEARVDGSFRQRWRQLWFRTRHRPARSRPVPGRTAARSRRPIPAWFGGMTVGGVALLTAGYLAVGVAGSGDPVRPDPSPSPFGLQQQQSRLADLGPRSGGAARSFQDGPEGSRFLAV